VNLRNINLFPQPAHQVLFVDDEKMNQSAYTITDISGRILLQGIINNKRIEIQSLENGMYFLSIVNQNQTVTESFIVAH
jgi:hypothetical protein